MIGRTQLSKVEHDEEFNNITNFGKIFIRELELETAASRKCLERFSMDLFKWKPHEKSMEMGYLTIIVAEIPKWIMTIISGSEIDFAKLEHLQPKTTEDIVNYFDENVEKAKKALQNLSDEELTKPFYLKNNGQVLVESTKLETLEPTINHLVHHRGQLTVYLRLNDIEVPAIYGPSADDRSF